MAQGFVCKLKQLEKILTITTDILNKRKQRVVLNDQIYP